MASTSDSVAGLAGRGFDLRGAEALSDQAPSATDAAVEPASAGYGNLLLLGFARVLLAGTALAVIWLVPEEPVRHVALTYASLIGYLLYGLVVLLATARLPEAVPARWLPWIDVLFAGYMVALSDGTNSIFFFLFFFSILSAAFTRGFREGLASTVASVVLYTLATLYTHSGAPAADLDRLLIRPIYLAALGFLLSYWGGVELELKRRVALLVAISGGLDVRQGVHATIDAMLRRLRDFFHADAAMLAIRDEGTSNGGVLHSVSHSVSGATATPVDVSHETLDLFLAVPGHRTHAGSAWPSPRWTQRLVPLGAPSRIMGSRAEGQHHPAVPALANIVETNNIAVAGYHQGEGIEGRLVLARARSRFTHGEAAFLAQCARAMAAVVENVRLAEELVSRAARSERVSVSRDLHDTTIQPYIGLRMAIEGVLRDFRDDPRVAKPLRRLLDMTELGIRELRDYAARLKSGAPVEERLFHAAVEHQADRWSRYYGIPVNIDVAGELQLAPRVEDAVLQILAEALSNVHRHTTSRWTRVRLRGEGGTCRLEIENEHGETGPPRRFVPKSIDERVRDLSGRLDVDLNRGGSTVLTITLPQVAA